jgi:hAT family C-terminal dimerisation region
MSDKSERVFSGARRTILWERMQLGPENIERVECLKNWHKSKISVIVLTGALDTAVYGRHGCLWHSIEAAGVLC